MNRLLRVLPCLPLLAPAACAADLVAGPEPAPGPHPQAVRPAQPAAFASIQLAALLTEPLYVIDGVPITDPAQLQGHDPRDIETVRVIRHISEAGFSCRPDRSLVVITLESGSPWQRRIQSSYRR